MSDDKKLKRTTISLSTDILKDVDGLKNGIWEERKRPWKIRKIIRLWFDECQGKQIDRDEWEKIGRSKGWMD